MKKLSVMFGVFTAFLWSTQFISIPTFAEGQRFPDVLEDVWYTEYIYEIVDDGIMKGLPDGTFGTWKLVDRAELAKVIVELKRQVQGHWLKDNLFEIILILATVFGWMSILNSFRKSQEEMMRELARIQSNGGPPPPSPPPAPKAPAQPTPPFEEKKREEPSHGDKKTQLDPFPEEDEDSIDKNLKSNWWV